MRRSAPAALLSLLLLLGLGLQGCGEKQLVGKEELRSGVRAGISAAGETDLLIQSVNDGRLTRTYAREHPLYLAKQIRQSVNELSSKECPPDLEEVCETVQSLLNELYSEVTALPPALEPGHDRGPARRRTAAIRAALLRIQATL